MSSLPKIRLVALDIDGTVLNSRHEVSNKTKSVIQKVYHSGVQIVLASARSPHGIQRIMTELGVNGFMIALSGALIGECTGSLDDNIKVLHQWSLSVASTEIAVNLGVNNGVSVGWYTDDEWYTDCLSPVIQREADIIGQYPWVVENKSDIKSLKVQWIANDLKDINLLKRLMEQLPDECTGRFSNPTYVEITHKQVSKSNALAKLGYQLGIQPDEMIALGDGENDIPMLQFVSEGIAMGNASSLVKSAAKWVTSSNDQDGVAMAIEKLNKAGRL